MAGKKAKKKDSRIVRIEQLTAESVQLKDRIGRLGADQHVADLRAKRVIERLGRLDRLLALIDKDFGPGGGPAQHVLNCARECVRELLPTDTAPMEQTWPNTQAPR